MKYLSTSLDDRMDLFYLTMIGTYPIVKNQHGHFFTPQPQLRKRFVDLNQNN